MFKIIGAFAMIITVFMCAGAEVIGSIAHPFYNKTAALVSTYAMMPWYLLIQTLLLITAVICLNIGQARGE